MRTSDIGIRLICEFEGFRAAPYLCPAGVPTIGWGSTRYESGDPVRMGDPPISEERAACLLRAALREFEGAVSRYVREPQPLPQHQFDALVSFAYNCGPQALRTSTLLRKINEGDAQGAAAQFSRWVHGGGRRLPGLVKRRAREAALFLGGGC